MKVSNTFVEVLNNLKEESQKGIHFILNESDTIFLSYQGLYHRAFECLSYLRSVGCTEGDELIILIDDNQCFLEVFWACLLGKIIPVPINPLHNASHELKFIKIFRSLDRAFIVGNQKQYEKIKILIGQGKENAKLVRRFVQQEDIKSIDKVDDFSPKIEASDIAYIQFSSGSTGDPKGVTLSHENLLANTGDIISASQITKQDTMLSWMPLTHDMGLIGVHLCGIRMGIDQFLMSPKLFVRKPLLWLEKASSCSATLLYSPNFGYSYLLSALEKKRINCNLEKIRIIYNGAEPIFYELCQRFVEVLKPLKLNENVILPVYGLAEASVAVTIPVPGQKIKSWTLERQALKVGDKVTYIEGDQEGVGIRFVEVGKPIEHCSVRICNNKGNALPEEVIGHIQIKGKNVTVGYYNNDQATAAIKTKDGWINTGDLGFLKAGNLIITGRSKNLIIINGQNYYPQDIERAACKVPGVKVGLVAACQVSTIERKNAEVVLFVVNKRSLQVFSSKIRSIKQSVMESIGIEVQVIVPIRKLPKTTSGKVQYFKLAENYEEGLYDQVLLDLANEVQPLKEGFKPHTTIERALTQITSTIWPDIAIDSNGDLSNMRLDSLKLTQFLFHIEKKLGYSVDIQEVFNYPNLPDFAAFLETKRAVRPLAIIKNRTETLLELTPAQKRIWILSGYEEHNSPYNISTIYSVNGPLEILILAASFSKVIKRHEILRTQFLVDENGRVLQKICEQIPFSIQYFDKRKQHFTEAQLQAELDNYVQLKFDLGEPGLFRAALWQMEKQKWIFALVMHHIISDGWSMRLLLSELQTFYKLHKEKKLSELSVNEYQYRDYLDWHTALLKSKEIEIHRDYWLKELGGSLPITKFSPNTKASIDTFEGASHFHVFSKEKIARLKVFSSEMGLNLFINLTGIIVVLLYKFIGQRDIIIGTNTYGRTRQEFESIIGYFINTICLRLQFKKEFSYLSLLKLIKNKLFAAIKHQNYPFEVLLNDLQLKNSSVNPLFNVFIAYQNFEEACFTMNESEFEVHRLHANEGSALVDLYFDFRNDGDTLELEVKYAKELFDPIFINALPNHLERMIDLVCEQPSKQLKHFQLLSEEDVYTQIEKHKTSLSFFQFKHAAALFEETTKSFPETICLVDGYLSYSYQEVNSTANRLARLIVDKYKVQEEERIAIILPRSYELVSSILAVVKSGGVFLLIDPDSPKQRTDFQLRDSKVSLVISSKPSSKIGQAVSWNKLLKEASNYSSANLNLKMTPSSLAYIIYTSGTTGKPKGILIEQLALVDYIYNFSEYFQLTNQDRVLLQSSVSFDVFIEELFPILTVGGSLIINRKSANNIEEILRLLDSQEITIFSTVPKIISALNQLVRKLPHLRALISGGDRLLPNHIDKLWGMVPIYNTYGPSETTVCASYYEVEDLSKTHFIGKPLMNHQILLLDEDFNLCPEGVKGEIAIAGNGLARGYLNDPKLTKISFPIHPYDSSKRIYLSGDYGRWSSKGNLEFIGRKDDQIKMDGGIRIEPAEVENIIMQHPAILHSVVLTSSTSEGNKHLNAFYTISSNLEEIELSAFLLEHLPQNMMPARLIELADMPTQLSGKIDKQFLHNFLKGIPSRQIDEPQTSTEHKLLKIWREVLGREDIGTNDNFFAIEGDSIKAVQIISRLKGIGINLNLKDFFQIQSIKNIALKIGEQSREKYRNLTQKELHQVKSVESNPAEFHPSINLKIASEVDLTELEEAFNRYVITQAAFHIDCLKKEKKLKYFDLEAPNRNLNFIKVYDSHEKVGITNLETNLKAALNLNTGNLICAAIIKSSKKGARLIIAVHWLLWNSSTWNIVLSGLERVYYNSLFLQKNILISQEMPSILHPYNLENQYKEADEQRIASELSKWNDLFSFKLDPRKEEIPNSLNPIKFNKISHRLTNYELTNNLMNARNIFNIDNRAILLFAFQRAICNSITNIKDFLFWVSPKYESYNDYSSIGLRRLTGLAPVLLEKNWMDRTTEKGLVEIKKQLGGLSCDDIGFNSLWQNYYLPTSKNSLGFKSASVALELIELKSERTNDTLFELSNSSLNGGLHAYNSSLVELDLRMVVILKKNCLDILLWYNPSIFNTEAMNDINKKFSFYIDEMITNLKDNGTYFILKEEFNTVTIDDKDLYQLIS